MRSIRKRMGGILLLLGLLLSACGGPSIEEKQAEFAKKIAALESRGFVRERSEADGEKGHYLLRLEHPEPVSTFLIRSLLGSADPEAKAELSKLLRGVRLELEVSWRAYAEGAPGSVRAYLLPPDGNGTGELRRLMRERKIAADLDFDKEGGLKRIVMHPLDEPLEAKGKKGRLVMRGSALTISRVGSVPFDQEYRFESDLLQVTLQDDRNGTLLLRSKGLRCHNDTTDAYYGLRECRWEEVGIDLNERRGTRQEHSGFLFGGMSLQSRVVPDKKKTIRSEAEFGVDTVTVTSRGGAKEAEVLLRNLKLRGTAGRIAAEAYRRLADLMADPPATPEETLKRMTPILAEFFRSLLMSNRFDIERLDGHFVDTGKGETTEVALREFNLEAEWGLADDLNLSKRFRLGRLDLNQSVGGTEKGTLHLEGFTLGIALKGLYNFLPGLMRLAAREMQGVNKAGNSSTDKALELLGGKVVRRGAVVSVDPLKIASLRYRDPSGSQSLEAMELRLDVRLAPNRLDPSNPMAPMLALAYLTADGKAQIKKKDLQTILPTLDPAVAMMVNTYVRYEGDRALFDVRFEQGNLRINGKPFR